MKMLLPIKTANMNELVSEFLSSKNANTVSAYRNDLMNFKNSVGVGSVEDVANTLVSHGQGNANFLVLRYKNSLKEQGLQSATINRRLSSIRSLIKLAKTLGLINWSLEIQNEKHEAYRDVRGVGVDNVNNLMDLVRRKRNPKAIRDYCVTRMFYDLGLRVSELITLDLPDLDSNNSTISILGKGRTQRELLTLPDVTKEALVAWLEVRPNSESEAIFINLLRSGKSKHQRITRNGVYKVIRSYGEQLNIKTSNHKFRHDSVTTAVRQAQKHEISLHEVLKFSRHKSLTTLQIYADSLENHQGQIAELVSKTTAQGQKS